MSENEETVSELAEKEGLAIRSELSKLSFEELQKLKERIGARVYKEAMFGKTARPDLEKLRVFKRENKNRPREMSSKKPVSMIRNIEGISKKKNQPRDPRFDPLCGEFDKKTFKESYAFLNEVRAKDANSLREELKHCEDLERRETIKLLLQRLKNQMREEDKNKMKQEKQKEEKQQILSELKEGKRRFASKGEKRVENLVEQFEELRNSGKLQKHIERRKKKLTQKSKKRQTSSFA